MPTLAAVWTISSRRSHGGQFVGRSNCGGSSVRNTADIASVSSRNATKEDNAQHPDRDAQFAVNAIRTWWYNVGLRRYPDSTRLLITADSGGSNGYRLRACKVELAALAAEIGRDITVAHYPTGASKWNKSPGLFGTPRKRENGGRVAR